MESPQAEVAELAEIIGGAHYLRTTCAGQSDQVWRDQMLALLEIEAPQDGRRRQRMIDAFNTGFSREERRFRNCTQEVRRAEAALAAQGRRLAERLSARYMP